MTIKPALCTIRVLEEFTLGYTKLFYEIITSTIWAEKDYVRVLWITMLAMKDRNHEVMASVPGLASMARISQEECEQALEVLMSPDKYSRSKEFEGRRIEPCDGGWHILNGEKYRQKMNLDERREYNRKKQREYRAKKRVPSVDKSNPASITVNDNEQCVHISDTDTDTDTLNKDLSSKEKGNLPGIQSPTEEFMATWNAMATSIGLDSIHVWTAKRGRDLATRLREKAFNENWREAIKTIPNCKQLIGGGGLAWKIDATWFLKPDKALEIAEGKYLDKDRDRSDKPPPGADDWMSAEGVPE